MTRAAPARGPDRREVLARVDLAVAADRFLGAASGAGSRRRWPCPAPGHPAADRRPSIGVFRGGDGVQRWKCRTCGEHGTAIDLVMATQQRAFPEALRLLDDLADEMQAGDGAAEQPAPPARPRVSRDVLLSSFDLPQLADELVRGGRGRGRSRTWPCPSPQHGPQTGRTPPVSIRTANGTQRWKCFSCGAGGTAIDLVMAVQGIDTSQAFAYLTDRLGAAPTSGPRPIPPAPAPAPTADSRAAVARYVERCESLLWDSVGMPGRAFLARRGLEEPVLRANRVGYDPGPALLSRPSGLPRRGPAIVMPVVGGWDTPIYLQARYLAPAEERRYDNVAERLAGASPRVAFIRPPGPEVDPDVVLVCEGQLDALSAAQAGYAAAAVLSAGLPDEHVAHALLDRYPSRRLVLAFDDDDAGRTATANLADLLAAGRAVPGRITAVTPDHGDLNEWLRLTRREFAFQLRRHVAELAAPVIPPESLAPSSPDQARYSMPASGDYHVQVWHAQPGTADDRPLTLAHTFAIPAALLAEDAERARAAGQPADLPVVAAQLAADLGGTDEPERYVQPYRSLASGYHDTGVRPVALGDVFLVTAPDADATTLAWAEDGMREVDAATALTASQPEPSEAALPDAGYQVDILKPVAPDVLRHAHTLTLSATVVGSYLAELRETPGEQLDPAEAAAALAWELGVWDPDERLEPLATMAQEFLTASGPITPGDVVLVTDPAGARAALQHLPDRQWQRLPEPPAVQSALQPDTPALLVTGPDGSASALPSDTVAFRELAEPPPFGPPGHDPDTPQIEWGPEGPTMPLDARAEVIAGQYELYAAGPGLDLGPDL